jgi:hypothetical protein
MDLAKQALVSTIMNRQVSVKGGTILEWLSNC